MSSQLSGPEKYRAAVATAARTEEAAHQRRQTSLSTWCSCQKGKMMAV